MELTLGPILFDWTRNETLRFYEEAAALPVDRVYVGEAVCVKKLGFSLKDVLTVTRALTAAGKKVTLSSLAVISNEDELQYTRDMCGLHGSIEANDMAVLNMAEGKEIFAGPHITSYNAPSIEFLKGVGLKRVCFPVELPKESVACAIKQTGIEAEVFAHGKLPLAFSWRCYTGWAYGLTKTECRHHCAKFPDGMEIKTIDGKPLFTVNGTSILSAHTHTLVESIEELSAMGVKAVRISPQHRDTAKVVSVFRRRINGDIGPKEGLDAIKAICKDKLCNGWYQATAGKDYA
ncbi:MAG: U32 family peptidase [Deltaproteobacteria bacterium]|nr:U32 family peptidase [Deltaproteobacteria bacterium]